MKLTDTIRRASELSETINDYWLRESPKRHKHYPLIYPGEEPPPPPPEEAELEAFLSGLPLDELHRLIAVSDVGQYTCRPVQIATGVERARRRYPSTPAAVIHVMNTGLLHESLVEGLADLRKAGVEIDTLDTVPV